MAGFSLATPLGGELGEAEAQPLRVTLTLFWLNGTSLPSMSTTTPKSSFLTTPYLPLFSGFMALSFTGTIVVYVVRRRGCNLGVVRAYSFRYDLPPGSIGLWPLSIPGRPTRFSFARRPYRLPRATRGLRPDGGRVWGWYHRWPSPR